MSNGQYWWMCADQGHDWRSDGPVKFPYGRVMERMRCMRCDRRRFAEPVAAAPAPAARGAARSLPQLQVRPMQDRIWRQA